MLNYNDDTLAAQLYAGILHKDHESLNMDGEKEGFKMDKLVGTKKENGGSSASGDQKFCWKTNTFLTIMDMKRDTGTDTAVSHFKTFST